MTFEEVADICKLPENLAKRELKHLTKVEIKSLLIEAQLMLSKQSKEAWRRYNEEVLEFAGLPEKDQQKYIEQSKESPVIRSSTPITDRLSFILKR